MSAPDRGDGPHDQTGRAPELEPRNEPPENAAGRERERVADHGPVTRDTRPALGTPAEPSSWLRASPDAGVALARPQFGDARWSFLYKAHDTSYAATLAPDAADIAAANRRMREAPTPDIAGPIVKQPVWTWQVPLYFWAGGVASGAGFIARACDLAADARSARIARKVALGAVAPAPLLLIADLGRPERFLNMLRIFKPRSPMNMGAWCLVAFSTSIAGAVGADQLKRPRIARGLGALTSVLGGYLGSYTGVLLSCTAVPLWAHSRLVLGPVFVATATATGAAATRLALAGAGLPEGHPTRSALGTLETAAILTELSLSGLHERRLGPAGEALHRGRPGQIYRAAKTLVACGLAMRLLSRRVGHEAHDLASVMYLIGGLAFRFAWVSAGRASAADDGAVAAMGRRRGTLEDAAPLLTVHRSLSKNRAPVRLPKATGAWGETARRISLLVERLTRRRHPPSAAAR